MASAPASIDKTWQTDLEPEPGSGSAIRAAIARYHSWYKDGKKTQLSAVKAAMIADLKKSNYSEAVVLEKLAAQIIATYDARALQGPLVAPPTTQQEILDLLGIRKMCLEFAVTIAYQAHGIPNSYPNEKTFIDMDSSLYRPGMGLYRRDHGHAMVIIAIKWNKLGQPESFRVAEANYGSHWQNPGGMVPWERTLERRDVPVAAGLYHVINFEKRNPS
jgi:hypothetical protein